MDGPWGPAARMGRDQGREGYSLTTFSLDPEEDKCPQTRYMGHLRP